MGFVLFDDFVFLSSLPSLLWGDRKFLNFNLILTIFGVPDAPTRGIQVLFGHQNQQSAPHGLCSTLQIKAEIEKVFSICHQVTNKCELCGLVLCGPKCFVP
jgi:hypothetical protein